MSKKLICVICNEHIPKEIGGWEGGANAEPVQVGRCCKICDDTIVIPTRIRLYLSSQEGANNEKQ